MPFPIRGEDDVVQAVLESVTPRTRLALLDHVTSPTALVFSIERLVKKLEARGVDTLVDGAHALGMVPLDLARIGAAYYTGNAHKWLCAPKGTAFLHVRKDRQRGLHPTVISHGYSPEESAKRFQDEFDWTGTNDPTGWLTLPECIHHLGSLLPGGWPALMESNHSLALRAQAILLEALGVPEPCPERMIGSMASVPLPAAAPRSVIARLDHESVMTWFRKRGVEIWLYPWDSQGGKLIRVSAQLYNGARKD